MDDHVTPGLSAESRRYLERMLEDCRAAQLPGSDRLILLIEMRLRGRPEPATIGEAASTPAEPSDSAGAGRGATESEPRDAEAGEAGALRSRDHDH